MAEVKNPEGRSGAQSCHPVPFVNIVGVLKVRINIVNLIQKDFRVDNAGHEEMSECMMLNF